MNSAQRDYPRMLVEARIEDIRRDVAKWRLAEAANAQRERRPRLHRVKALAWMAVFFRRAELSARERASQPKTRSQSMQMPSGTV
ncbi:MAG: hypothetical protein IT323_03215 [Anaerolineae bacterium]|nr:hypothetical protein [Anaerolineae bacterium]